MAITSLYYACLGLIFWSAYSVSSMKTELTLERFEAFDAKGILEFGLRVRKMNHSTHSLNGTFNVLQDLGESYELSVNFAYSSLGNNQYNEYPMKVPRRKLCQFMVDQYQRTQYLWANHTNMPHLPKGTTEFCPFPKGAYWIRDVVPDAAWVPPVVPTGLWRMKFYFWDRNNDPLFQMMFYVKFSKKIY